MKRIKCILYIILYCVLSINLTLSAILMAETKPPASPAEESIQVLPQDSLVVITSSSPMGKRAGNGFVIGDGSLVVTAHHIAFEESLQGQHNMAGNVVVYSPYLGDAANAEIIGSNEHLDLAVLKVPWKGHPALQLADDNRISSAQRLEIISIPSIIKHLLPNADATLGEDFEVQRENLAVDFVAAREQTPRFISLSEVGQLGDGWSGSPMLLPGTSKVVGCFVRLHWTEGQTLQSGQGPAITQVTHLLANDIETKSLESSESLLSKPKDGADVFILFLQAYSYYSDREYESASKQIESVLQARSESAFAYDLAASIAEHLSKPDQAERHYQKALELNPDGSELKIMYAQFLSSRQPEKSLEVLQSIWEFENSKPAVALLMFNILSERGEYQRCSELLNEALKVNPNNAYLWFNLGACHFYLGKLDDAINPMTKAVELLPEYGPLRGQLARTLEKEGKLDEAEKHFRELLNIEPDNPVVHMWLAQFLAKYRPLTKEEAIKEAQIALELPVKGGLSKEIIEQFIQDMQSRAD
jgi:tetratricopeptide (TPR) repeat protein